MRRALPFLVLSLGLFSIVAQTLLFRTWMGSLEGTELAIGSFFGAWLLWVGAGALLARVLSRYRASSLLVLTLGAFLYLPAFVLQQIATFHARDLAGVPTYEVFPLDRLLGIALLVNAPVSLLTGFSFTWACRVAASWRGLTVARVYVLECLGGFVGGIGVTLLLAFGVEAATVFLGTGLVIAAAAAFALLASVPSPRGLPLLAVLPAAAVLLALLTGVDRRWTEAEDRAAWARLLPAEALEGEFATTQARYLHGWWGGAFHVVSWGAVVETVPDALRAGEVAAIHLAQAPRARRILVVGPSSLAICLGLAALPQVERVAWFPPDPAYAEGLRDVLPEDTLAAASAKLETPDADVRVFLEGSVASWDLAILNLPDVATLVENRYATRDFFALLEHALAPDGIVSLRVHGGENVLGGELVLLGASALATLESVFENVVLEPGEESWLIASNGADLTDDAAVLRDRWAAIEGAAALYPPDAMSTFYLPDRIAFQMAKYRDAIHDAEGDVLLNTERAPKALLYGLALAARRTGRTSVAEDLPVILETGVLILAAAVVLYGLLRVLFLRGVGRGTGREGASTERPFDAGFLIFSTGLAGMALGIVLMFAWQSRFGSLYLAIGLVSSLFMLGLFLGSAGAERLLSRSVREPFWVLPLFLAADGLVLAVVALLPATVPPAVLAALFVFAGGATGLFFPLAAHRLRRAGRSPGVAGAVLETADHLGGAMGAAVTGLLLLPLFGTTPTLLLLALLIAVNLAPRLVPARLRAASRGTPSDRVVGAVGYVLLGLTAWVLLGAFAVRQAKASRFRECLVDVARELVGEADLEPGSATLEGGGTCSFLRVTDEAGETDGWVFDTSELAADVVGYGGPIALAVRVDDEGTLEGFAVLASRETPAYLAMLGNWREHLVGRNLFAPGPFAEVDAVTGATATSDAVLRALECAGRRFARDVLGRDVAGADAAATPGVSLDFVILALLTLVAVLLRYRPHVWVRRAWLLAVLVVSGLWLNTQYSGQHVFSLVSGEIPGLLFGGALFLVVAIPVVVLLFGNIYCGWLCPFGAAQELLGDVGRRRWDTDPRREVWRWGRSVKYALLALLLVAVALTGRRETLAADPLVTVFSGRIVGTVLTLALLSLLLSLVFGRFFCRNLCPAGAFLALLSRARLLRRILPLPRPSRCDFGVRRPDDLDCISCDRCRHAPTTD